MRRSKTRCIGSDATESAHEARTSGGSLGGLASGERSELPLKANDHALDATRYALHTALRQTRAAEDYPRTWLGWRRTESPGEGPTPREQGSE